jgi:hypothetical protein
MCWNHMYSDRLIFRGLNETILLINNPFFIFQEDRISQNLIDISAED